MIRPHEWVPAREVGLNRDWTVCRNCGFILRGDRENEAAACKGRVRVELRESPDTQPVVDLTGAEVTDARLRIRPITHRAANAFVHQLHRHSRPTVGAVIAVAVADAADQIRGVAIAGRPVAPALQDGLTMEILRVCTDGSRNACSMLYGACRRAARALGYQRILTYTLPTEGGASLRAAGFRFDGDAGGPASNWHNRPGRTVQPIGDDLVGGKWRWVA